MSVIMAIRNDSSQHNINKGASHFTVETFLNLD